MIQKNQPLVAGRRPGFSMLELLIVVLIIAILAALSWAASLRLMGGQQRKNTEDTVQKLGDVVRRMWQASFDQANEMPLWSQQPGQAQAGQPTPLYPQLYSMAGSDGRKYRVLFRKYYLRRDFPISFAEIQSPAGGLPPDPTYSGVLPPSSALTADEQAGVCLYMILLKSRRGIQFDVGTSLSSNDVTDKLQSGQSLNQLCALKIVCDAWSYPLRLYRWPYQSPDLNPNGAHPMADGDREDPDGALTGIGGSFSSDCHPVPGGGMSYKMEPVIVSAGENSVQDGYPGLSSVVSTKGLKVRNPTWSGTCIYSSSTRLAGHGVN